MTTLDVKSASSSLLQFLDQLSPFSNEKQKSASSMHHRTKLDEQRKDVDRLTNRLQTCSWVIATLLHSLDEIKRSQSVLTEERAHALKKAKELVLAEPKFIYLPHEILTLIAQYVYPKSISVDEVIWLKSKRCKWAEIVWKSSRIFVNESSFNRRSFYPHFLLASSPAKLDIHLSFSKKLSIGEAIQSLIPFRARWHSITFGADLQGAKIRNALFDKPCPNCKPPRNGGQRECAECANHTIFSFLQTLTIRHSFLPSFSGTLKAIKSLTLIVHDITSNETAIGFSKIATEAPSLSSLTIVWRSLTPPRPATKESPGTLLPNLKRVTYIQEDHPDLEAYQFAFSALDARNVEELVLRVWDPDWEWKGTMDDVAGFLEETFPLVKSLALRMTPIPSSSHYANEPEFPRTLEPQTSFLSMLVPPPRYQMFPCLTHLSVEFDQTAEACNTILEILQGRRDLQGPSLQAIQSLDLLTEDDSRGRCDPHDLFSRAQALVKHLTVHKGW